MTDKKPEPRKCPHCLAVQPPRRIAFKSLCCVVCGARLFAS